MIRTIFLVAALLFAAMPTASANNNERSVINVDGSATIEVEPNEFTLRITLDEGDTKGRIPLAEQQRKLIDALTAIGVDCAKQLKSYDMNSDWNRRRTSLSSMQFLLILPSVDMLYRTYEALMPLGVSDVDLQNVTHTDLKSFESSIRREAIQNAKAKAKELATAIGQNIGACCSINDYGANAELPIRKNTTVLMRANADSHQVNLEPTSFNSIKIKYRVAAQFILTEK